MSKRYYIYGQTETDTEYRNHCKYRLNATFNTIVSLHIPKIALQNCSTQSSFCLQVCLDTHVYQMRLPVRPALNLNTTKIRGTESDWI